MSNRILETLADLRTYALTKGCDAAITYHEEDSYLTRFANSAISLNTNEHLIRVEITAYWGRKRASYCLITNLSDRQQLYRGVDAAAEMARHAQPLSYDPTIPTLKETYLDESCWDPSLAQLSNEDKLSYVEQVVGGLESEDLKLSGIFSSGTTTWAQINTRSEHAQYFRTSDAQITMVLAHQRLKWEVQAEQSAQAAADLDPAPLQRELALLVQLYREQSAVQLPLGSYDIVLGPAAVAELVSFMNWIGFDGGLMKRGYSFLSEQDVGRRVLSEQFSLLDDPRRRETFPFRRDLTGIPRQPYPIFSQGVFQGFVWDQDDADEFGASPTGHTVPHKSIVVSGGTGQVSSLEELLNLRRDRDLLYIPFLHYMNIVNPSKGIITASSRFGALLLKADGSVVIPFNVRLTQSLPDIFGDKVAWLSEAMIPYNTSQSYGARNPTAIIVPRFTAVRELAISHSNSSY